MGLELELVDVLNRKVDVLTYNSLHPLLKDYILKEQVVFYEEAWDISGTHSGEHIGEAVKNLPLEITEKYSDKIERMRES